MVATGGEISGELEEMGFWVFFWGLFHGWRMVFLNNRSRVFFFFFFVLHEYLLGECFCVCDFFLSLILSPYFYVCITT